MTTYTATFTTGTATRNSVKDITHAVTARGAKVTFHSSLKGAQAQAAKLSTARNFTTATPTTGFEGIEIVEVTA